MWGIPKGPIGCHHHGLPQDKPWDTRHSKDNYSSDTTSAPPITAIARLRMSTHSNTIALRINMEQRTHEYGYTSPVIDPRWREVERLSANKCIPTRSNEITHTNGMRNYSSSQQDKGSCHEEHEPLNDEQTKNSRTCHPCMNITLV
jgi:hypothetical protein